MGPWLGFRGLEWCFWCLACPGRGRECGFDGWLGTQLLHGWREARGSITMEVLPSLSRDYVIGVGANIFPNLE